MGKFVQFKFLIKTPDTDTDTDTLLRQTHLMNICTAFGRIIFIVRRIVANEHYLMAVFCRTSKIQIKALKWTHDYGFKMKIKVGKIHNLRNNV